MKHDRGWNRGRAIGIGRVPKPGDADYKEHKPYVRGSSGQTPPAGADTYPLDGEQHRFDGRCHADCPDVR